MARILSLLWSITLSGSVLITLLLIIRRMFFGRISPKWQYAAWGLVLLRLMIPFSIESVFSVMNVVKPATSQVEQFLQPASAEAPQAPAYTAPNAAVKPDILAISPEQQDNTQDINPTTLIFFVWLIGVGLVMAYMIFVNMRFSRGISKRNRYAGGAGVTLPVCIDDKVSSPCLVGVFRPCVVITPQSAQTPERLRYVLLHEMCHYKRRDNLFALLRNIFCAVYWFNPLVWIAAIVSRKDCELACDAMVLSKLNGEEATAYGETLLSLVRKRQTITGLVQNSTTMTGGKKAIKERIKLIAKRPKPLILTMVCVVLLTAVSAFTAFTGAVANRGTEPPPDNDLIEQGSPSPSPQDSTEPSPSPSLTMEEIIDECLNTIIAGAEYSKISHESELINAHPDEFARIVAFGEEALPFLEQGFYVSLNADSRDGIFYGAVASAARNAINPEIFDLLFPSPDGKYILRAPAYSFLEMYGTGDSGVVYREIQLIDCSTGIIVSSGDICARGFIGESHLQVNWSEDGQYAAISQRYQHATTLEVINTQTFKYIHMPKVDELRELAHEVDKQYFVDILWPYFVCLDWLSGDCIKIEFGWSGNGMFFISGWYIYDLTDEIITEFDYWEHEPTG